MIAIQELYRLLLVNNEQQPLIDQICHYLTAKIGFRTAWIVLLHADGVGVAATAASGFDNSFEQMDKQLRLGRFPSCLQQTIENPLQPRLRNTDTDCSGCSLTTAHDCRLELNHGLCYGERIYGMMSVSVPQRATGSDDELTFLDSFSGDLACALANIQTMQALQESRLDLQRAQKIARVGDWRIDLASGRVTSSHETREIYGLPQGEPITVDVIQRIPLPQYRQALDEELAGLIKHGNSYNIEFQIRRPSDGNIRHIHSVAEFDRDQNLVVGTIQDITELKRHEEALARQHQRLNFVIEGSRLGTWEWDVQSNDLVINRLWAEILGYTPEELHPHRYAIWQSLVHPDDLPAAESWLAGCLAGTLQDYECEYRIRHKNGSWVWVLDRGRVMTRDHQGKALLMFGIHADITERKIAEQELKERQRYLDTILQTTAEGFRVLDLEGNILEVNQAYCTMSGYSREELLCMAHHQLEALETHARIRERLQRVMATGSEIFETLHRRKDGTTWPVEISVNWLAEKGGRFICFCRDMTERKRADEELQASHRQFRDVVSNVPGLVYQFIMKPDGTYSFPFLSHGISDLLDRPVNGTFTANQLFSYVHPDDAELMALSIAESIQSLDRWSLVFRIVLDNGTIKWLRGMSQPNLMPEGSITWNGILLDITELKTAEEEVRKRENLLRKIFEIIPIGLWVADKDGNIVRGNPTGFKIWGEEPDLPVSRYGSGKAWRMPDHEQVGIDDWPLTRTIRDGITIVDELFEIETADGKRKTILNYSAPVRSEDGSVEGAVVVNLDVSDRRALETQLQLAQKMESVGRLAGGVAHDFNNMLGVIIGYAEMALEEYPHQQADEPIFSALKEIQKAAERSAGLTRQLLAFARKQTIIPKTVDLNEVVAGMLTMLRRLIGEHITLSWRPGVAVGAVRMDPTQLDQILANLCVNAKDAVRNGGTIWIETSHIDISESIHDGYETVEPGNYAMLMVSDDGCGMDNQTRDHLFEPFFTTKSIGEGTGLGLATVYGIVKQNKGYIDVASEPEAGSRFTIYLPCDTSRGAAGALKQFGRAVEPGSETILLVEDEKMILEMTMTMLTRLNYRVIAAATPGEAIAMAREHAGDIHVLITDVVMPEMNGRELAKAILSLYPGIKRLFISGHTADIMTHHGILEEGVAFLQKPFTRTALADKIRSVLN